MLVMKWKILYPLLLLLSGRLLVDWCRELVKKVIDVYGINHPQYEDNSSTFLEQLFLSFQPKGWQVDLGQPD